MTCSVCSGSVERTVLSLDGVVSAQVNLLTATMTVTYDESKVTPEQICNEVEDIGFEAIIKEESSGITTKPTVYNEGFIPRQKARRELYTHRG